jgi:hypothetical protein
MTATLHHLDRDSLTQVLEKDLGELKCVHNSVVEAKEKLTVKLGAFLTP